jgi:transposase
MGGSGGAAVETAVAAPKRRRRSIEERRRIVEETYKANASVARVARAHGVNANQVFYWRGLYQRGLLGAPAGGAAALVPVTVSDARPVVRLASAKPVQARHGSPAAGPAAAGIIHLELPKGRLRIEGPADPAALRTVLEFLLG